MGLKAGLLLLSLILFAGGCAIHTVRSDYEQGVDTNQYRTFAFLPRDYANLRPATSVAMNPVALKRIKRAIERELSERGYQKVDRSMADFVIAYHVGVKKKVDIQTYGYTYRYHRQSEPTGKYNERTLVVDFVDRNRKELFWRGWAQGVVGNRQMSEEEINRVVDRIIEKFPMRKQSLTVRP